MKLGTPLLTWGYDKVDLAVVIGHSRSPRALDDEKALEVARDQLSAGAERIGGDRWWSVTKAQVESGEVPEEAEIGSYSSLGQGQAWVDVAFFAERSGFDTSDQGQVAP